MAVGVMDPAASSDDEEKDPNHVESGEAEAADAAALAGRGFSRVATDLLLSQRSRGRRLASFAVCEFSPFAASLRFKHHRRPHPFPSDRLSSRRHSCGHRQR